MLYRIPLNNLSSLIPISYMKWERRSWKWGARKGKWEIRSWKREIRYEKWETRNLEVGGGMALNCAPRNGKWDSSENSRD